MGIETLLFPTTFIIIALFPHPYLVGILLAMTLGYRYGRSPIIAQYLMDTLEDKRYKATMLSIKGQLSMLGGIVTPLILGYLVSTNIFLGRYRDGIMLWGIGLFVLLVLAWIAFLRVRTRETA